MKEVFIIQYSKKNGYILLVMNLEHNSAYCYQVLPDGIIEGEASKPFEEINSEYISHGVYLDNLPVYGLKSL